MEKRTRMLRVKTVIYVYFFSRIARATILQASPVRYFQPKAVYQLTPGGKHDPV